ncbi:MAG: substrate-binding domain-containing protein [Bifidobacteriaceae bacterium]|jgi:DNA-binding LacI/PurR family transcriptional regulator|nr:substrate-binding domain-containing protein [Bifidobacteriaceae bacterium]
MAQTRLLPDLRRERLAALLRELGTARVAELAAATDVTALTIRRDLKLMEERGLIERVHGGARLVEPSARAEFPPAAVAEPPDSALAPQLRGQIAMLAPALDFYWPDVSRAAEAEARRFGLRLMLRGDSYENEDERPALAPLFASESVCGVLAVPNVEGANAAEVIDWIAGQSLPCVLMEREAAAGADREPVESVVSDHAHGAELAVRYLWGLGHRRIGLMVSRTSPTTRKVRLGFERVSQELGAEPAHSVSWLIPSSRTIGFNAAVDSVIDQVLEKKVTGLLVHSDREAMALVQHLEAHSLRVPDDISVIAYDDEIAEMFTPALTAVRPAREALGRAAVDLLVRRLLDPGRPVHRMTISPVLRVRESSGPPPSD